MSKKVEDGPHICGLLRISELYIMVDSVGKDTFSKFQFSININHIPKCLLFFRLVDKMLKTQIVECAAVANWLFSREMTTEFTKCYVWEILHLTVR